MRIAFGFEGVCEDTSYGTCHTLDTTLKIRPKWEQPGRERERESHPQGRALVEDHAHVARLFRVWGVGFRV